MNDSPANLPEIMKKEEKRPYPERVYALQTKFNGLKIYESNHAINQIEHHTYTSNESIADRLVNFIAVTNMSDDGLNELKSIIDELRNA